MGNEIEFIRKKSTNKKKCFEFCVIVLEFRFR